jgi:cobalt-zinc-cadmium efflux system membrane fusion protein
MFVDVTITSDRGRDDVVVPAVAVQTVGDKRVAFTPLGADRFQSHDLTVGVERQDWVEVRQGLSAGDTVVTQGSFELKALLQKAMLGGAG